MIPLDVNELTIKQFMAYNQALKEPETNFAIIMALTDLSMQDIENMPLKKLELLVKRVEFLRTSKLRIKRNKRIFIKGKLYKAFDSLSANQFTALDTFNTETQLNQCAAICYGKWYFNEDVEFSDKVFKDLCEKMNDVKVGKVWGQVFFYTNELKKSRLLLQASSEIATMEILNHMREISQLVPVSEEIMAGIMLSTN